MPEVVMLEATKLSVNERQRKEFEAGAMDELLKSIMDEGLLHPIVVNLTDGGVYELVAGERRARAIQMLHNMFEVITYGGHTIPLGTIPATILTDMTEEQKFSAELSENLKRRDLTWQEKTAALSKLHAMRKGVNPEQTYEQTASEVKKAKGDSKPVQSNERMEVREAEIIEPFLNDEDVAKAKSSKEALKIINKKLMKDFDDALDLSTIEGYGEEQVHTLLHLDMREFVSEPVFDLVITDPPYGIGVEKFGGAQAKKHEYSEEGYIELYSQTAEIVTKVCKPAAHVYIFLDIDMFHETREYMEEQGWTVRRTPLVWDKGPRGHLADGGVLGYRRASEFILYAYRGGKQCNGLQSDVLRVVDHSETHHAAQKPTELYRILMQQSANIGDKVLDLFAGSGVVFSAADEEGLIATGVESNEETVRTIEIKHGVFRHEDGV